MTQNQIAYQNFLEQKRSNMAREFETNRSNVAVERLRALELDETRRSNLAREAETNRSNLAREFEIHRANVASENLGYANLQNAQNRLQFDTVNATLNYNETVRHNQAVEQLQGEQNDNTLYLGLKNDSNKAEENEIRKASVFSQTGVNLGQTGAQVIKGLIRRH